MILRRLLLASGLLLASVTTAKKDGPKITATKLAHEPRHLFYFEDTDTIVFQHKYDAYISTNAGESWDIIKGPDDNMKGKIKAIFAHPYDRKKAYALGQERRHWTTDDAGKSWREFRIDKDLPRSGNPLTFHGTDSNKVILHTIECAGFICRMPALYTTDGFKSHKTLVENQHGCYWAITTPEFGMGIELPEKVDSRTFCIFSGLHSPFGTNKRLLYSDDFFEGGKGIEVPVNNGRPVSHVVSMAGVKKFLLTAAKSPRTNELALYVTDDAVRWHQAMFDGHKLENNAYTVLESTNYSIQIGAKTTGGFNSMSALFTSNSNGTYFTRNTEHVNSNHLGYIDFEKIAGIQGIFLVNSVSNWEDIEKNHRAKKKLVSQISFDDGRTFNDIKAGDKKLHLHSVTHIKNSGRVFSSPAPGLVMGVGNTGEYLQQYEDGDLYVSDNAGITWWKALDDAHKYEFGDQGSILVAVYDEGLTSKVSYSINHGKDWKSAELPHKIRARQLTTTPDSTSLKFLLLGTSKSDSGLDHYVMALDFNDLHERKCGKDDFERWPARLNEKNEPDCLMGHKQFYRRRKPKADCFIGEEFKDPVPELERCKCTEEDYECDFNFVRSEDKKECVPARALPVPEGQCKKPEDKYRGSSGFRLIPGDDCIKEGGLELDKPKERPCTDTAKEPVSGEIGVKKHFFSANEPREYYYMERPALSKDKDETIVLLTDKLEVFITKDHGKSWKEILAGKHVAKLWPHAYNNDIMYFITGTKRVYVSKNRGESFREFRTKLPPNRDRLPILSFHPDPERSEWLIWTGADNCGRGGDCHSVAHYSTDGGDEWHTLMRYVGRCEFIGKDGNRKTDEFVFCAQHENEDPKNKHFRLLSSEDWFTHKTVHYKDILDFRTMSEFIIVAARAEKDTLKVGASIDGKTFADAEFPPNFDVKTQQAYTVLDSSTHSVWLHVTVHNVQDHQYGSIIKSNSNGTSYVLSLSGVNRNNADYVDFEKMQGLEGVALVNIISNIDDVNKGAAKKLRSMITHNDGAEWAYIPAPANDVEGRSYGCSPGKKGTADCALHLHSYTERRDFRDTYSSPSAVGLMLGVGNVGDHLTLKSEGDTFITRDGGIEWHSVKKGNFIWEYGDQGSIIVIVPESKPTQSIFYTLDEGKSWTEFKFTDVKMQIFDISTVPSDTSRNFLLWGKEVGSGGKPGFATINLDFSGLKERSKKCVLKEEKPEADDYYIWEPKHPLLEDNCLFGHIARYHRKKPEAQCFNGGDFERLHNVSTNCECTRQDYECDYNYERQSDGSCALVAGLEPLDPKRICTEDPNAVEYFEPTGYRRIPLTTCEGGVKLDGRVAHPCPNKEKEFKKKHPGLHGIGLFFVIVLPIAAAGAVGYYVYTRWEGKFGHIRLGETRTSGDWLSRDSPLIAIPVTIIAATVAVISALPLLATSLWRSLRGWTPVGRGPSRPYSSRGAFAARRGDYVGVVEDEDELLGVEDFEGDEDEEA
ncbi:vacuolar protein sorting/targeting protein PEP1 [Emydomyces testavorans]|uniref:Vacuolar protein sorting/targeting protein 10 n=1 Tax=Emydomyces testavorans TaxID=2070801 RepID=A0AAF0DH38_9EURO|nr:vacuolar protein sorting/targeting protein PEP1 [Emydomyces testavorans]